MSRGVNLPFRRAINEKLTVDPIKYVGVTLPVCDTWLNTQAAFINIGTDKKVRVWIQLLNQTSTDDSPKCLRNDVAQLQIQVRTTYNANSGGYEIAEQIADTIINRIFPQSTGFDLDIEEPFNIWKLRLTDTSNVTFPDTTDRVWMVMLTLQAEITQ